MKDAVMGRRNVRAEGEKTATTKLAEKSMSVIVKRIAAGRRA